MSGRRTLEDKIEPNNAEGLRPRGDGFDIKKMLDVAGIDKTVIRKVIFGSITKGELDLSALGIGSNREERKSKFERQVAGLKTIIWTATGCALMVLTYIAIIKHFLGGGV